MQGISNRTGEKHNPLIMVSPQTQISEAPCPISGRQDGFYYSKLSGQKHWDILHNKYERTPTEDNRLMIIRPISTMFFKIHLDVEGKSLRRTGTQAAVGREWQFLIPSGGEPVILS